MNRKFQITLLNYVLLSIGRVITIGLAASIGALLVWGAVVLANVTVWDAVGLLLLAVLLGAATLIIFELRDHRQQARQEQLLSKQAAQYQRELETDRFQAAALQTYLDRMTELLLERGLRVSAASSEVRSLARARTLTILRELDGRRKGLLIQFLHATHLIQSQAVIDLAQADLRGAELSGADLVEIVLPHADLSGARLHEARLRRANLSASSLIVADLSRTDLRGANLRQARLVEATATLADLSEADLSEADLHGANLEGANLVEADLHGANLAEAFLTGTSFIGADLRQANLRGADLTGANLHEVDLSGADLTDATLDGADLVEARMNGTQITRQQLAAARPLQPIPLF